MTPKFNECLSELMFLEGNRSNEKWDPGGDTWFGISSVHWPVYFNMLKKCANDEERMFIVREFFFKEFWTPMRCEEFSKPIAFELLETSVNLGLTGAAKLFQTAIRIHDPNIKVDGIYGPMTVAALKKFSDQHERNLIGAINGCQFDAYRAIVERNPNMRNAFLGWCARCAPTSN